MLRCSLSACLVIGAWACSVLWVGGTPGDTLDDATITYHDYNLHLLRGPSKVTHGVLVFTGHEAFNL